MTMKDIIISTSRIKKELTWLIGSFIFSIIFNIYSIIRYDTGWKELFTQIHVLLILTLLVYFLLLLLRLLVGLVLRFTGRKKS
jgi:hypothetical protein